MKRNEFIDIMSGIMEMYPGRFDGVGNFAMEMWYEALSDLDFSTAKLALLEHIKTSKFPPTVADIREKYKSVKLSQRTKSQDVMKYFDEMKNYYPNGNDDVIAESEYICWILDKEPMQRLQYAKIMADAVIRYVKNCESGEENLTLTFGECIKYMGERI